MRARTSILLVREDRGRGFTGPFRSGQNPRMRGLYYSADSAFGFTLVFTSSGLDNSARGFSHLCKTPAASCSLNHSFSTTLVAIPGEKKLFVLPSAIGNIQTFLTQMPSLSMILKSVIALNGSVAAPVLIRQWSERQTHRHTDDKRSGRSPYAWIRYGALQMSQTLCKQLPS